MPRHVLQKMSRNCLLAGSARPDMPGASEGPAPIMRVFGITMEGNSGQDSFLSEQVFRFLIFCYFPLLVPYPGTYLCVENAVHIWSDSDLTLIQIFLPWSRSSYTDPDLLALILIHIFLPWSLLILIQIFLPWSRSSYPDPGLLTLIQIFLPWFRSSYPDPDLITLIQIFLPWFRSSYPDLFLVVKWIFVSDFQWYGSADPYTYQNVPDPQHCFNVKIFPFLWFFKMFGYNMSFSNVQCAAISTGSTRTCTCPPQPA